MEKLERREVLSTVSWSVGPSLPEARSEAVALLAPDDAVIVLGGNVDGNLRSVPKLSNETENWVFAPELDLERVGPGASVVTGNAILIYGGVDGNEGSDEVLEYDYSFGDSQDANKLDIGRSDFAYATDEAFRAYAIGGLEKEGEVLLDSIERYDAIADLWSPVADLPSARRGAAAIGDKAGGIYVFGGTDSVQGGVITDTVFRYDVLGDSWSAVSSMPLATVDSAVVAADDGLIYVLGGRSASGTVATVQAYDPTTDTWSFNTDLPVATHSHSATIDGTGRIVVLGGVNASGDLLDTVYRSQRLDIPDSAPVFITDPISLASLDTAYSYNVHASSNPEATYSLPIAPAGMTIDPETGLIQWQPIVGQHGQQDVTVRAENQVGFTDQSFVIDIPVTAPSFTSSPVTTGSLDDFYSYTAVASGSPLATYSLAVAPIGMAIDPTSGLISWQPALGQEGQQPVTVRSENFVGFDEQSYVVDVAFDTIAPAAPTFLEVGGVGTTTIDLNWLPATDNRGIAYYEILKGYRSGWRGRNTSYRVIETGITDTNTTLAGLDPLSSHKLVVRAVDGGGNVSTNSNQVIAQTQAAPTLRYYANGYINGQVSIVANNLLELTVSASANPAPTYSLVSAPAAVTIDPVSGLLQWTPTAADVGIHTIIVEGTNTVGTGMLEIPLTVSADSPVIGIGFSGLSVAGTPLEIQISDWSQTPSTFELIDGPVGMVIDSITGLIQWLPTTADAGQTIFTIQATNSAGTTEVTRGFETYFTGQPTNIQVTGETLLIPTISWDAPVGVGADEVAGYTINASVRYRYGRSYRTHTVTTDVPGGVTSAEIMGLRTGREYKIVINAYNGDGERGIISNEPATVKPIPAIPTVNWTISNPGGGAIVATQPVEIQLNNLSPDPATFSLLEGPVGLMLDAVTGLATWTPGISEIGSHSIRFRATNSVGPRDVTVNVNVLFSGMVTNVVATKSGNTANVSWTAPTDNVVPVDHYRITLHWNWSSRRRTRTFIVPNDQLSTTFSLIPTGAVWHRGVTISVVDEFGRVGDSTSLIHYGI